MKVVTKGTFERVVRERPRHAGVDPIPNPDTNMVVARVFRCFDPDDRELELMRCDLTRDDVLELIAYLVNFVRVGSLKSGS